MSDGLSSKKSNEMREMKDNSRKLWVLIYSNCFIRY